MRKTAQNFQEILRGAGYRATPGKIQLLETLSKEPKPLTVSEIQKKIKKSDVVTLYRSLEALTQSGIIARSELGHGHAHYELTAGKKHHHHLVCTACGIIEDIEGCSVEELQTSIAKKTQKFKSIYSHNIEFFGSCVSCSK